MNTEKLIETARKCGERTTKCSDCQLNELSGNCVDELNKMLALKLEMAIEDLTPNCKSCVYSNKTMREMPCAICVDRNKWLWRGND